VLTCIAVSAACALLLAQAPEDSPQIKAMIEAAKQATGPEWAKAANFFCATEEQVADMHILPSATAGDVEAQRAEPMKVFENLYFVGQKAVATWAITTPEGIILIDAGYADRVDDTLVTGLKGVGLDPAAIKYVLIAHGHTDHYGGAKALQDRYHARIAMSAEDWDFIEPTPGQPAAGGTGGAIPARDLVLKEGQPITLGGENVTPVFIPGHTPGSMGFIFPVKDAAQTHIAGLFGGSILNPAKRIPIADFRQYLKSLGHWRDVTKQRRVDVELMNHPIMDDLFTRLATLKARKPGAAHPLVVGEGAYQRYATAQAECMKAQVARRERP
jgi:metallo-beta-lactamase class B